MFSDRVGRIIQTKTKGVIFNPSTGLDENKLIVSGKNIIDHYGRVVYSYYYNRLIKVEYPNSLGNDVFYEYGDIDPNTGPNNQTGRLTKMQDASGVQTFEYGNMGEMTKNIHTFAVPSVSSSIICAVSCRDFNK